ncbi:Transcription initiation factor TFIID subunit 3 [Colletotrichum chlorophyti]|uniref:Transcription initiation factor TFIID subunit 3 n=1 Tax=Colletotrichum chlorophyti TaxID=708187 RepID=A0A1Q8RW67_9PEZI|nr:Transcription initiation factor TFIID subunit 3 [Colletotrichum chlorophyti]
MTPPPLLFHALLRPAVLQILRTTGYHATRPVVLDAVTELAARYMLALCQATARHAADNHPESEAPGIVDVRMALQELGAVPPDDVSAEGRGTVLGEILESVDEEGDALMNGAAAAEREWERQRERRGPVEDTRGVDEFVKWFGGTRCKAIREAAVGDGELELGDYLNGEFILPLWEIQFALVLDHTDGRETVLKKKHSKTGEDSKYHGTILGKGNDVGEVQVEGGDVPSIHTWRERMCRSAAGTRTGADEGATSPRIKEESRPPSSGLSSVGDRLGDDRDNMDLS